jgi:DNA helicase INO80
MILLMNYVTTGEGHFDDLSAKPSGAATPIEGPPPKKKRVSKKAKTAKQRLAIADGQVDF